MSRGRRLAQVGLVVVVALLVGTILVGRPQQPRLAAAVDVPSPPARFLPAPEPSQTPVAEPGNLDDDIGSIMVVSTRGTDISPALRALLTDGRVGGLLLFGSNFGSSPAGLKAWSDRLQAIASSACLDHPILLMTDEEGGQVAQVRAGFAPPSELVADAVMTTAVYVPGLGGGRMPALFSPAVVSKLRTQLGFGGVIMTDSLSMGGIGARWSLPDAAVLAVAAGNDLVLLSNGDPGYEADAMAAVRMAVLSGRLDRAAVHASAMRVNTLRDRFGRRFIPCRPPTAA